jgi:hypothetical protein
MGGESVRDVGDAYTRVEFKGANGFFYVALEAAPAQFGF